ncbi:MAG: Hsp20/alpha crystallin family protein [Thaumarchaeota archaeon]|nr:Hsp20/alpha crystallin family protein [Nitrososphaerota archaeon]
MERRRPLWKILLDEFRRIESEINRMEEEMFRMMKEAEGMRKCITPLYNLYESGDEVILTADLPGANKEEIDLRVQEDNIRIEAPCRSPLRKVEEGKYILHVKLPTKIDPETAKARYKDGVLEVLAKKKIAGFKIKVE